MLNSSVFQQIIWITGQRRKASQYVKYIVDNYVKSLPPIFLFRKIRWHVYDFYSLVYCFFGPAVNVCAGEMQNRHPPFLIIPSVLHLAVCVFSLVPSLCFIFNLGLHCKQIHRPDGGPAGWDLVYVGVKWAFFSPALALTRGRAPRDSRNFPNRLEKWPQCIQELIGWLRWMFARTCSPSRSPSTANASMQQL